MFDTMPSALRESLWQTKHSVVRWIHLQGYAQSLHVQIQEHLQRFGITLVIDVGANAGQYAHVLRRIGYRGRIISVEPNPDVAASLAARASGDDLWDIVQVAASDTDGEVTLNLATDSVLSSVLASSSVMKEQFRDDATTLRQVVVPARRMDTLLAQLVPDMADQRVHLKIDTQGFDMKVLRGSAGILPHVHSLLIEVSLVHLYEGQRDYASDLMEIGELGFHLTSLCPVVMDAKQRLMEADALFCR